MNTPILLLAFNRPDLVKQNLERLRGSGATNIWISVDGPRNENTSDTEANQEIQAICKHFSIERSRQRFESVNQGCRDGVISGISWFFQHVDAGIILEDDVEIDSGYLRVIEQLLKAHRDDMSVYSISSHGNLSNNQKDYLPHELVMMPMCRVWGWGTWKDRWQRHVELLEIFSQKNLLEYFLSIPWKYKSLNTARMLMLCREKIIDTWDYEWNFTHVFYSGNSVTPRGNYCRNHGFRADATHTVDAANQPWTAYEDYPSDWYDDQKPIPINESVEKEVIQTGVEECGFQYEPNAPREFLATVKHMLSGRLKRFLVEGY